MGDKERERGRSKQIEGHIRCEKDRERDRTEINERSEV